MNTPAMPYRNRHLGLALATSLLALAAPAGTSGLHARRRSLPDRPEDAAGRRFRLRIRRSDPKPPDHRLSVRSASGADGRRSRERSGYERPVAFVRPDQRGPGRRFLSGSAFQTAGERRLYVHRLCEHDGGRRVRAFRADVDDQVTRGGRHETERAAIISGRWPGGGGTT